MKSKIDTQPFRIGFRQSVCIQADTRDNGGAQA